MLDQKDTNTQSLFTTFLLSILVFIVFLTSQGIFFVLFLFLELKKRGIDVSNTIEAGVFKEWLLEHENNVNILVPTSFYSSLIGILFILLILKMSKKSYKIYLGLIQPRTKLFLFWIGISFLYIGLIEILSSHFEIFKNDFTDQVIRSADSKLFLLITAGFIAPIFEEVFFRGFLFKNIENSRLGSVGAVIITSLLFAVIHIQYDLYVMSVLIPVGFILGLSRLKTQSLFVPIAIHIINNSLSIIMGIF
jgi:uncharacterized protein